MRNKMISIVSVVIPLITILVQNVNAAEFIPGNNKNKTPNIFIPQYTSSPQMGIKSQTRQESPIWNETQNQNSFSCILSSSPQRMYNYPPSAMQHSARLGPFGKGIGTHKSWDQDNQQGLPILRNHRNQNQAQEMSRSFETKPKLRLPVMLLPNNQPDHSLFHDSKPRQKIAEITSSATNTIHTENTTTDRDSVAIFLEDWVSNITQDLSTDPNTNTPCNIPEDNKPNPHTTAPLTSPITINHPRQEPLGEYYAQQQPKTYHKQNQDSFKEAKKTTSKWERIRETLWGPKKRRQEPMKIESKPTSNFPHIYDQQMNGRNEPDATHQDGLPIPTNENPTKQKRTVQKIYQLTDFIEKREEGRGKKDKDTVQSNNFSPKPTPTFNEVIEKQFENNSLAIIMQKYGTESSDITRTELLNRSFDDAMIIPGHRRQPREIKLHPKKGYIYSNTTDVIRSPKLDDVRRYTRRRHEDLTNLATLPNITNKKNQSESKNASNIYESSLSESGTSRSDFSNTTDKVLPTKLDDVPRHARRRHEGLTDLAALPNITNKKNQSESKTPSIIHKSSLSESRTATPDSAIWVLRQNPNTEDHNHHKNYQDGQEKANSLNHGDLKLMTGAYSVPTTHSTTGKGKQPRDEKKNLYHIKQNSDVTAPNQGEVMQNLTKMNLNTRIQKVTDSRGTANVQKTGSNKRYHPNQDENPIISGTKKNPQRSGIPVKSVETKKPTDRRLEHHPAIQEQLSSHEFMKRLDAVLQSKPIEGKSVTPISSNDHREEIEKRPNHGNDLEMKQKNSDALDGILNDIQKLIEETQSNDFSSPHHDPYRPQWHGYKVNRDHDKRKLSVQQRKNGLSFNDVFDKSGDIDNQERR